MLDPTPTAIGPGHAGWMEALTGARRSIVGVAATLIAAAIAAQVGQPVWWRLLAAAAVVQAAICVMRSSRRLAVRVVAGGAMCAAMVAFGYFAPQLLD